MSAVTMAELSKLQSLREQRARSLAAAAGRASAQRDQAADDAGRALEQALARDAQCRAMSRFCIDRIGLATQGVMQAIAHAAECRDDAEAARVEHRRELAAWHDADARERHLTQRIAQIRRAEDRKAGDRRDLAAIVERNAMAWLRT